MFLDDVECLPPLLQAKLLRFIQEKEFRVLGSSRLRRADVRIVTASNCSLYEKVKQGSFRLDLFYRLNVVSLNLPPLRRRSGDIPLLAASFLQKYAPEFGQPVPSFSQGAMQKLLQHQWPGTSYCHAFLPGSQSLRSCAVRKPLYPEAPARLPGQRDPGGPGPAGKNRRAFFELMRKHSIEARRYRNAT